MMDMSTKLSRQASNQKNCNFLNYSARENIAYCFAIAVLLRVFKSEIRTETEYEFNIDSAQSGVAFKGHLKATNRKRALANFKR